jgi:Broad-minded protein
LSDIASSDRGRKFILNVSTEDERLGTRNSNDKELLRLFTSFVEQSLMENKPSRFSSKVIGASIFFLRQFYRTWEGLLWIEKLTTHESLAKSRRLPGSSDYDELFDVMLIDNLLNFGATNKGVVLLHNSKSMVPCVSYMLARYTLIIKISKEDASK